MLRFSADLFSAVFNTFCLEFGLSYFSLLLGEYVLKDALDIKEEIARDLGIRDGLALEDLERLGYELESEPAEHGPPELPCLSLEEALQLVGLEDTHQVSRVTYVCEKEM